MTPTTARKRSGTPSRYTVHEPRQWAWEQEAVGNDKLMLLAISEHGWECWASTRTLAAMCGVDVRTARRSVGRLQAAGLLQRTERHRPDGSRTSNLIRLAGAPRHTEAGASCPGDPDSSARGDRTLAPGHERLVERTDEGGSSSPGSTGSPATTTHRSEDVGALATDLLWGRDCVVQEATGSKPDPHPGDEAAAMALAADGVTWDELLDVLGWGMLDTAYTRPRIVARFPSQETYLAIRRQWRAAERLRCDDCLETFVADAVAERARRRYGEDAEVRCPVCRVKREAVNG